MLKRNLKKLYEKILKCMILCAKPFIAKWRYDYWMFSFGTLSPSVINQMKNIFKSELENNKKGIIKSKLHEKFLIFDFIFCFIFFGAWPEDYFMHRFHKLKLHERNKFLTLRRLNFFKIVANKKDLWYILNDKIEFNKRFNDFLHRKWCDMNNISIDEFAEIFSDCNRLIVKPIGGNCGKGIYTVDIDKDNIKEVYNKILDDAAGDSVIAEEYFYQKGTLHNINPCSLNTLRVSTVRINGKNEICEAYFRTGCGEAIIDNYHSGGIIFPINNETGKCYSGCNILGEEYEVHPLSKIHIAGMTIPYWEEIKKFCFKAHNMLPEELHWIGWDVCLSNDEILLIEGNAGPGTYNENINHWKKFKSWLNELYKI